METVSSALNLLSKLVESQNAFVIFSFIMLTLEALIIYALVVAMSNKAVVLRRKELGMNEVEQSLLAVFQILNSRFLTLAKERFGDDYFNEKDVAIYRYVVTLALEERKSAYLVRIRRNHFEERSAEDWHNYVEDCLREDDTSLSKYLDEHHHPRAAISRPELYEWNRSARVEINRELRHLLNELLRIAIANKMRSFFGIKLEIGA